MNGYRLFALVTLGIGGVVILGGRHLPTALAAGASASAVTPGPAQSLGDAALRGFFKGALAGAKLKDKVTLYDEKGLFDYIDGGAPLYVKHHFRKLGAAEVVTDSGGELVCDIYDMNAAENATTIFDSEKSAAAKPVTGWPGAAAGPMWFVFHHGCYYVKLTAFDKKAEATLPALARALRDKMK